MKDPRYLGDNIQFLC